MAPKKKKDRMTTVKLIEEDLVPFDEIRIILEPLEGRLTYIGIMRKATRFYLNHLQQEQQKAATNG